MEAVKNNGMSIRFVGFDMIDQELCEIAYINDKSSINHMPEKYKDKFKSIIINEMTENECLIQFTKIEKNAYYYKCNKKVDHIFETNAFDEWIKTSKNTKCIICTESIDIRKIYCNKYIK